MTHFSAERKLNGHTVVALPTRPLPIFEDAH
jgi:hypothetical protein